MVDCRPVPVVVVCLPVPVAVVRLPELVWVVVDVLPVLFVAPVLLPELLTEEPPAERVLC